MPSPWSLKLALCQRENILHKLMNLYLLWTLLYLTAELKNTLFVSGIVLDVGLKASKIIKIQPGLQGA